MDLEQIKLKIAEKKAREKESYGGERFSRLGALGTGFAGGLSGTVHGVAQPILESGILGQNVADYSKNIGAERARDLAAAQSQHPFFTGAGQIAGSILPLAAAPSLIPSKALAAGASVLSKIPKGPLGLGNVTKGALAGAAGGATQYVNPEEQRLSNALEGAKYGGMFTGGMGAAGWAAGKTAKAIKEHAMPYAMADKMKGASSWVGDIPEGVFEKVSSAESRMRAKEASAWSRTEDMAYFLDKTAANKKNSWAAFDKTDYIKSLNNEIDRLKSKSKKSPSLAGEYQDSIELLENFKMNQLNSWEDAINAKKVLNEHYRVEKTPGKSPPFDTIKKAISSLDSAIDSQIKDKRLDSFKKEWDLAKGLTKDINQTYHEIPSRITGKNARSGYSQMKDSGQFADKDTFVQQYVPKSAREGVGRLKQFSAMVGGDKEAADILKPYTFSNAVSDNGIDISKFFSTYKKLSKEQKGFLFTDEQNKIISKSIPEFEHNPAAFEGAKGFSGIKDIIKSSVMPVSAGLVGGFAAGVPAGLAAAAASYATPKVFRKYGGSIVNMLENDKAKSLASQLSKEMKTRIPYGVGALAGSPEIE